MQTYRPTVAVYGGANLDIQARCRASYRPGDSNPGTSSIAAGGVGRNIAENLARMGLATELVTVFGDDESASYIADGCRSAGVEVGRSLILPGKETSRYVCVLDADGSLVGAVAAMDAIDSFGPAELAMRFGPGDEAEIVVVDANLPAETIAMAAIRWKDKPLLLDSVSVAKAGKAAPVVGSFSIVKPNRHEARVLLGLHADDAGPGQSDPLESAMASARALLGLGVREAFVSLGPLGLLWACKDGMGLARPLSMPVVSVSGAGDAATAALAWSTVMEHDTATKASYAVAASSLCASCPDAVTTGMSADRLAELVRGVINERIS